MMSTNWDLLIENHFNKKGNEEEKLSLNLLMESIGEVLAEMPALDDYLLTEQESKGKTRTYTIKQIPLIPISELGWANNDDGGQGGTQRSLLEDWLRNIEGAGFQEKLNNVQTKMTDGFRDIPSEHNDVQKYIQEVMSYLVFVKTLTMAITNFNASAAGFNFEAFLATLMGGQQIPASGAKTIADFTADIDGETVPVSLKLYTEGQLEVGGSFTDLVNDMINPNSAWASWASKPEYEGGAMKYVVCTKDFEKAGDDPLARKGVINFYEFDISRANIFRLLADASKAGKECIASSKDFMAALSEWDKTKQGDAPDLGSTLPTKTDLGSATEMATTFSDVMKGGLGNAGLESQQVEAITKEVTELYIENIEATQKPRQLGTQAQVKRAIATALYGDEADTRNANQKEVFMPILELITKLFRSFKEEYISKQDKRGEAVAKINWMYGRDPELAEWYESLSPEAKAIALRNTKGYLTTDHWKIPNKKAVTYGGGTPFAVLPIGAPYVQDLLMKVQNEVMDEVFRIFDRMAEMSDKLNSFFANGLKEKGVAEKGAEAGEEAAAGAREFTE